MRKTAATIAAALTSAAIAQTPEPPIDRIPFTDRPRTAVVVGERIMLHSAHFPFGQNGAVKFGGATGLSGLTAAWGVAMIPAIDMASDLAWRFLEEDAPVDPIPVAHPSLDPRECDLVYIKKDRSYVEVEPHEHFNPETWTTMYWNGLIGETGDSGGPTLGYCDGAGWVVFGVHSTGGSDVYVPTLSGQLPAGTLIARDWWPEDGPCSNADLAEPYGVLDSADTNAFATEQPPDLAEPHDVYDGADVNAFTTQFEAGCGPFIQEIE